MKSIFKNKKDIQEKLILEIEKQCFRDVIPRFQPNGENPFYVHSHQVSTNGRKYAPPSSDKRYITLKHNALSFFKEEYEVLSKVLILEWAKFLGKNKFYTSFDI